MVRLGAVRSAETRLKWNSNNGALLNKTNKVAEKNSPSWETSSGMFIPLHAHQHHPSWQCHWRFADAIVFCPPRRCQCVSLHLQKTARLLCHVYKCFINIPFFFILPDIRWRNDCGRNDAISTNKCVRRTNFQMIILKCLSGLFINQ